MVLGDGEADFCVGFEPSVFVHEDDVWRFKGVLVGEKDLSVIESLMELCVFWSLEGEVPSVEVVGEGSGFEVGQLFLLQFFYFCHDALIADISWLHDLI